MIQVTFQFNTLDEAIAFLGKNHPSAKIRSAAQASVAAPVSQTAAPGITTTDNPAGTPAAPATPVAAATKQRKPRSDKNKPRGSYKNVEAPKETTIAADSVQQPTEPASVASTPQTATPAAELREAIPQDEARQQGAAAPTATATATEKDAQEAIQKVFVLPGGPQLALDTLAKFEVKRCRDLKPDQLDYFVARCNEIIEGAK